MFAAAKLPQNLDSTAILQWHVVDGTHACRLLSATAAKRRLRSRACGWQTLNLAFMSSAIVQVLEEEEYHRRKGYYLDSLQRHYYFMNVGNGEVIDACRKVITARPAACSSFTILFSFAGHYLQLLCDATHLSIRSGCSMTGCGDPSCSMHIHVGG